MALFPRYPSQQIWTRPLANVPTIQRKCACGQHTVAGGECAECKKRRPFLQRRAVRPIELANGKTTLSQLSPSPDRLPGLAMKRRFNHDFSRIHLQSRKPDKGFRRVNTFPILRLGAKRTTTCSPTWYGDTTPEVDNNGKFSGKIKVTYNDAALKDPCVRDCVKEHEKVHVRQYTAALKKIRDCDNEAGDDEEKKGKCNAMTWDILYGNVRKWECEAYQKSYTCLTVKLLDSKSKCSNSPHREEIQKHRGYEACEMKEHCSKAGTPEAGIPVG